MSGQGKVIGYARVSAADQNLGRQSPPSWVSAARRSTRPSVGLEGMRRWFP